MPELTGVPRWTEQVFAAGGGQDHLGLGSVVTNRILPMLLPGINALTPHPRYWSFYAFVLDEFWNRGKSLGSRHALSEFFREKEMIFAVAGELCESPDHRSSQSPIGSRRINQLVKKNHGSYKADYNYIDASRGGYGLYYSTVMQTMGAVRLADPALGLLNDAVTPMLGKQLANAFRESISGTRYWKKYFNSEEVPRDVVIEYANAACLCQLRNDAPDRGALVEAFLHGGRAADSQTRRSSLQMMLELAHQSNGAAINEDDFRRLVLYGSAYDKETDVFKAYFSAPTNLESTARGWRLSQLREIFNWSLNGMWALVHEWGIGQNGDFSPRPTAEITEFLGRAAVTSVKGMRVGINQPIGKLIDQCRTLSQVTDSLDGKWDLGAPLTEDHLISLLREDEEATGEERMGRLFSLYVMSLSRLWDPTLPATTGMEDWSPVREGGRRRIGMQFALEQLRSDDRERRTVGEVLLRVIQDQVIAQHERVAMAKLPEDTFRFRREGSKIRFIDRSTRFDMNNSRFNSLSTACAELGWSGFLADVKHPLTKEGQAIRRQGDFQESSGINLS